MLQQPDFLSDLQYFPFTLLPEEEVFLKQYRIICVTEA